MKLNNLDDLVKNYGYPDALIDNHKFKNSGYALWGFDQTLEYNNKGLYINSSKINEEPFALLQSLIDKWMQTNKKISAIGFLSYDIKNIIYPHINFKKIKNNFPYMWFANPKIIKSYKLAVNHNTEKTKQHLSINKDILSSKEYQEKILLIKKELKKGNSYQINFTMPKLFDINCHPFKIYLEIRKNIKPDFGYYLNIGDHYILSFSPEEFFHTKGNIIESYPMKGTKLRGSSTNEDNFFKKELKNSVKDKAEHLMIVDLLRNDIGKISQYGSVKVKNLFAVNSYPTVHQMVSCVYGQLNQNIKHVDILKALHPGGSITGAPKESSMKIIDRLENHNRGIYTGTIGFINNVGDMCFNIAIRTLAINKNIGEYGVGGGIVWKSNPEDERNEAELKSKILENYIN
tara:strand:- start:211 stop:1419 length:1209 start_codon:yes stop_codon:yes gene_type:complete